MFIFIFIKWYNFCDFNDNGIIPDEKYLSKRYRVYVMGVTGVVYMEI